MLDHFQMGPNLGPWLRPERHRSARHQSVRHGRRDRRHQILGRIGGIADAVLVLAEGSRPEGRNLCRCRRLLGLQGPDFVGGDRRGQCAPVALRRRQLLLSRPEHVWDSGRYRQRCPQLGGGRSDLGFALRSAALRLCGANYQGARWTGCSNSGLAAGHRSKCDNRPDRDGWNGAADFFKQPPSSTLADIAALTKAVLVDPSQGGQVVRGSLRSTKPARCIWLFSTISNTPTNSHRPRPGHVWSARVSRPASRPMLPSAAAKPFRAS